jgi:FkbM family methyltransferase
MVRGKIAHALKVLAHYISSYGVGGGVLHFFYDLGRWAILPSQRLFSVRTPAGHKVHIRARSSDFLVFDEVILQQCYSLRTYPQFELLRERYSNIISTGKTPLVIDAGANIGLAAVSFLEQFPLVKIVGLEPVGQNFELAKQNASPLGNVSLLRECLWHRHSTLTMEDENAAAFSFRFEENANAAGGSVRGVVIDDILAEDPDLALFILKIDIEGAESEIFAAEGLWWEARPVLMIEPHDWLGVGRQSLRGVMQKPMYQDGDVIVKDSVIMFLPSFVSEVRARAQADG